MATCNITGAATITAPYSNLGNDGVAFPYEARVAFSNADSWTTTTSVGGWSYVDLDPTKNQNRGWGHLSSWFLIEITEAARFQLTLESTDGTTRPGFVLYLGESVEDLPGSLHTYSNNGSQIDTLNSPWDKSGPGDTRGLDYVTHGFNASGSSLVALPILRRVSTRLPSATARTPPPIPVAACFPLRWPPCPNPPRPCSGRSERWRSCAAAAEASGHSHLLPPCPAFPGPPFPSSSPA